MPGVSLPVITEVFEPGGSGQPVTGEGPVHLRLYRYRAGATLLAIAALLLFLADIYVTACS